MIILTKVLQNWKLLLAGLGLVAAFGGGWWLRPLPPPSIEERIVVIQRPDGTIEERTEEREIDENRTQDSNKTTPIARATGKRYSLGINTAVDLRAPLDHTKFSYTVMSGYRVWDNAPLWAELGYNWKRNEVILGVRLEF
jgi:hypothetical protein